MADTAKQQVVWAFLSWLKQEPIDESLEVVFQCLSEHYGINLDDASHKQTFDLGLNLEDVVRESSAKHDPSQEQKLQEFIAILKQKGYFQGVEEGSAGYWERYEKAKQKFQQRNNPFEGLTADQLKTQGNQKMTSGNYREAVTYYTKAIELDPGNGIYYANRAAAYTHLKEYKKAIEDCQKSISIDPTYSKAYSRLGTALFYEGNYSKAVENYAKAVELDPQNEGYKADLKAAEEKLKETESSAPALPGFGGAGGNPFDFSNLSSVLSNPEFMSMAQNVMKHPQFSEMVNSISQSMGAGGGAPGPMPDFTQMLSSLAAQQPADGSLPDVVNTPFGDIRREQLEQLQNMPELKENPKFQAIMDDVKANGPIAMMKYMNDPEIMGTMTKLATQLFQKK